MAGGSTFTKALAGVYSAQPDLEPQVVKSPGVVETVEMLEDGRADVGYSFANVAYSAVMGELPERNKRFSHLRAIALLRRAALHVLVGPDSPVREMQQLRGLTVKSSGPGAALSMTVDSVLPPFGLDPTAIEAVESAAETAIDDLLANRLGALIVLGIPPVPWLEPALTAGARLLPVDGSPTGQLLREYPFYSALVIPTDTYPRLAEPIVTVGVDGVLLCRAELPDDVVYRLTKALYESSAGVHVHPAFAQWLDPSVGAATPIPLHAGAARYYRERELSP